MIIRLLILSVGGVDRVATDLVLSFRPGAASYNDPSLSDLLSWNDEDMPPGKALR